MRNSHLQRPRPAARGGLPKKRGPGRPRAGDPAVRTALLQHARGLFLRHGFAAVSMKRIALAAGSTAAMVHYYFGDKLGLYRAMIADALEPVVAHLQQVTEDLPAAGPDLETVMVTYMRLLATNPWLPALIVHEVLDEGGQLREQFIEQFAGRLAPLFVRLLQRERERGRLRADLDPRLTAISAMSLCIFPFVSLPITSRVLGVSFEGEHFERLARHTLRLFQDGTRATATQ